MGGMAYDFFASRHHTSSSYADKLKAAGSELLHSALSSCSGGVSDVALAARELVWGDPYV